MPDRAVPVPAPKHQRCLAFDFGLKRIGVAVGNTATLSGTPLGFLDANDGEPDWRAMDALVKDWGPDLIVLGLPYNSARAETTIVPRVTAFGDELRLRYGLSVELVDEHLTSREAGEILRHQRASGRRKKRVKKGDIDSMAAMLIVETWLKIQSDTAGRETPRGDAGG
jgi:putative Holliday junction resolvase